MKDFYSLILLLAFSTSALATLPFAIDGQRLPSLAPMLKQVTPAVVNISTRGKKSVSSRPMMQRLYLN